MASKKVTKKAPKGKKAPGPKKVGKGKAPKAQGPGKPLKGPANQA